MRMYLIYSYMDSGTGKTTLAEIITNQIDCDVMYIEI